MFRLGASYKKKQVKKNKFRNKRDGFYPRKARSLALKQFPKFHSDLQNIEYGIQCISTLKQNSTPILKTRMPKAMGNDVCKELEF